jgi:NADH dehydrogenase/NADH:ubiquinone oxidoreductase subunit G
VDEIQIQADTIGESANTRVFKFSDFINISEAAFNVTAAVEYAKELPTYKPASTGSGASSKTAAKAEVKKEEVKKEEVKKEDTSLKQALSNGEIQNIAKELIEASSGSTDEPAFLSAVEKLKNKKDYQILDALLKKSKVARLSPNPYAALKEMGLSRGSEYENLAAMINGEMGDDDTGTVRLIKDHLKKIGADANYRSTKNGEFIEDSFTIK